MATEVTISGCTVDLATMKSIPSGTVRLTVSDAPIKYHDDDTSDPDVALEHAYWKFDAWRAGRDRAPGLGPMDERDAFKAAVRLYLFPLVKP